MNGYVAKRINTNRGRKSMKTFYDLFVAIFGIVVSVACVIIASKNWSDPHIAGAGLAFSIIGFLSVLQAFNLVRDRYSQQG